MKAKLFLFSFLFSIGAVNAFAQTTVTFGGQIDTQVGVREQKKNYRFDRPQVKSELTRNELHQQAIVNNTKIDLSFDTQMEEGAELGAKIVLNADTSLNKFNNPNYEAQGFTTYAFIESNVGRLEAGNTTGVYNNMRVSGATVARATGGIDGDVKYWWHPHIFKDGTAPKAVGNNLASSSPERLVERHFIQSPNLPSNYDEGGEANAAKINYISPSINGVQFGISYLKDTAQFGTSGITQTTIQKIPLVSTNTLGFNDVFSGVIKYDEKFSETNLKLSLAAEIGDAKSLQNPNKFDSQFGRYPLRAWEIGTGIEDSGFKFATSYGNWGRSGEIKKLMNNSCKKSDYWTIGGGFEDEFSGFSVTYFNSKRCGIDAILGYENIADGDSPSILQVGTRALQKAKALEILSFGFDSKPAPGFMPYVELSFFKINENNKIATTAEVPVGNDFLRNDAAHNKKNQGYVLMSGVKVQF